MSEKAQTSADPQRILAALMGMHRAYPLERRIRKEACDDGRETYLAVLSRWMKTAAAPQPDGFDAESLDELAALDAVFLFEGHIGCPPFSPAPGDIQVHFPHETLYALSALDALALPRLLEAPATVETRCAVSGEPIHFALTGAGELHGEALDAALVVFHKLTSNVERYALDLAPGIRFVLPRHGRGLGQALTLAEASAVANGFYGFQRKLLRD